MNDQLIDSNKAAEILGVSKHTLTNWRARGHTDTPQPIKLGRRLVRYSMAELAEYIARRHHRPDAHPRHTK